MSLSLAQVFNEHFKNVKFDKKLAKEIYKYQFQYINANREHLAFFGGNLLGVHVIRFKDSDVAKLFNSILDVDYYELAADIKKVPTLHQGAKVASDVFNLTTMYLIHRFMTSAIIDDTTRHRAAYDVALIFFYRCIAALMSYYFKYPTDEKIAQVAYANLSNKYLIKRLGTWHKVMDYRATDLVDGVESLHIKNLISFTNDYSIIYAVTDSQGRVRDLMKNYCAEFYKVHAQGDTIGSTSSTYTDAEGEENIKEKVHSVESLVTYARQIIIDKHTFAKEDLISVIVNINTNTSFRMIKETLYWLSDNFSNNKLHKKIDRFLEVTIVHSMHLLENNPNISHKRDYPHILTELKNLYLSTRSDDQELAEIRELGAYLVKQTSKKKLSDSLILSTRTSIILYIVLRVLVGSKTH